MTALRIVKTTALAIAVIYVVAFFSLRFYVQRGWRARAVDNLEKTGAELVFHDTTLSGLLSGGFEVKQITFDFTDRLESEKILTEYRMLNVVGFDNLERVVFVNCVIRKESIEILISVETLRHIDLLNCAVPEGVFDNYVKRNPECIIHEETPRRFIKGSQKRSDPRVVTTPLRRYNTRLLPVAAIMVYIICVIVERLKRNRLK